MKTTGGRRLFRNLCSGRSAPCALVLAALLLPAHAQSPGAGWDRYANVRFGFSVCYPATLKPQGEPDNSDGNTFQSSDRQVTVLAWGNWDISKEDGKQPLPALRDSAVSMLAGQGAPVEYSFSKANFVVVSGTAHKATPRATVYYIKRVLVGDHDVTLEFSYPETSKALMDPVVRRMSACLQGRDGHPIG